MVGALSSRAVRRWHRRCRSVAVVGGCGLVGLISSSCSLLVSTSGYADANKPGDNPADAADAGSTEANGPASDGASLAQPDASVAADGGVTWPVNGHAYVFMDKPITWIAAEAEARELGGHLVTLGSQAENDFVHALLGNNSSGVWIGAKQADGSVEPAGGWGWVTQEPFIFTAWDTGQPNNAAGTEDAASFGTGNGNTWNDTESYENGAGYVLEIE